MKESGVFYIRFKMSLQSILLQQTASLKDAIALLEATEEGIVLVVTDNNILLNNN